MPSPNKNKRAGSASPASWPENSPCISKADFGIGSYVMALWRNNFEYLAEVLAFRNRSREHPEYRLKFVWDRVVEWTPASRIRKATQAEISYVLKFVRRYGDARNSKGPAPVPQTKQATKQNCKGPVQEAEASHTHPTRSKNIPEATSLAAKTPPPTATTQSFGAKQVNRSDTKRKPVLQPAHPADSKVLTAAGGSGTNSGAKSVVARDVISIEGTVAHGDMLYDKSIAQFHEACRKRRELKRRAIDSDAPAAQQERQISSPVDVKPPPAKKSNVLTQDIKSEDLVRKSPGQNGDVLVAAATGSAPGLSPSLPSPPVKSIPAVGSANDDLKPTSTSCKITPPPPPPSKFSSPVIAIKEGIEEASPVAFQCPHCPRKLRRYSLLTAHICNYHRDDPTSNGVAGVGANNSSSNSNAVLQSPLSPLSAEVKTPAQQASPLLPRSCAKREAARSSQTQTQLPIAAVSVPAIEMIGAAPSGVKKQEVPTQKAEQAEDTAKTTDEKTPLLVFCPVCKFSGPSKERPENLLRCLICRVWCHRRCVVSRQYQHLHEKSSPEFDNWICESCATVPPHMPSSYRLRELSRHWGGRRLSRDKSPVEGSITRRRNLFNETLSLVNWLQQMQPMLVRGRQTVRRLRSSVSTTSNSASKPAADRNATELRADGNKNNNRDGGGGGDSRARPLQEQRFNGIGRHDDANAETGHNFAVGMDLSETDLPFISGAGSDDGISALLMNLPDMNLDALAQEDGETSDAAVLAKKSLELCEEERESSSAYLTLPRRSSAEDPLALSVPSDISRLIDNLGPDYLLGGLPYPEDLESGSGGQEGTESMVDDLWKRPLLSSSFLCCTSSAGTSAAGTPADTPALLAGGGAAAGNCMSPFDTPTKVLYAAALSAAEEMQPVFAPVVANSTQGVTLGGNGAAEEQTTQMVGYSPGRPRGEDMPHAGGAGVGNVEAQLGFLSALSVPRPMERDNSGDQALPVDIPTPAHSSWIEGQTQSAVSRALSEGKPSQDEQPNVPIPVTSSSTALSPSLPSPPKLNSTFSSQRKPQPPLVESVRDLAEIPTAHPSGLSYYASSAGLEHENQPIKSGTNRLEPSPFSSPLTPIKFESLNCTPEKLLPISWVSEYHQRQQHPPTPPPPPPPQPSPKKTATSAPLKDLESLEANVVGPLEHMLDAIEQHLNLLESEVRRLEEQEKEEAKHRAHLGVFQPEQDNDFLVDGGGVTGGGGDSCHFVSDSSCSSLSSSLTSPSRSAALVGVTSLSTSASSSSCSSPSHPTVTARDRSSSAVDSRLIPTAGVGTYRRQPAAAVRGRDFPPLRRSSVTDAPDRRADQPRLSCGSRRYSTITVPSSRPFPPLGGALGRPYARPTSNGQQQQGRLQRMYGDNRGSAGWQSRPGTAWHTSTTNQRYHR